MAKQQPPQLQNTSQTDTTIPIKGMSKDPNSSLVSKENWTHAINAINNSDDGDVGTLGNEQANKKCGYAPFTIIGAIHLYGDKWVLFSTNNEQSEIGTWDDSECKYEVVINDYVCFSEEGGCEDPENFTPCLNFNTQDLITGASKENFDCSWQVYWDDGRNPSRTLNLDNIPYIQQQITGPPIDTSDCITFEDTPCIDCEKLRLAPLVKIPCIELSKSPDGGQLRNGSYQAFIAYTINDQVIGDYYGISNIQPLFAHEDLLSGLELKITNLDTQFEYFQLVIVSNNQNEMQAKEIGFYSTHQSDISIDYINQALKTVPLTAIPLSTPAFEKSDHMYVVNDYLIRSGPYQQYDFNYQPLANEIHSHWTSVRFPADYYKKGGNKTNFMRDEVYAFFIRFIYNTGEKSASYHIPGRDTSININTNATPTNPYSFQWGGTTFNDETLPQPGSNDLATLNWNNNNQFGPVTGDKLFEVYNTSPNGANNFWNLTQASTDYFETDDGGVSIAEGHMAYWESTERYPNDPVRWNGVSGNPLYDLCGRPIRHHKFPDETHTGSIPPGGFLDRSDITAEHIHVLGVNFWNIKWPRYSINSVGDIVDPNEGRPLGPLIPNIVGYEILVGSREGNKSIIAKGIARNMRQYAIPGNAQGQVQNTGTTGYIPNYPFNSAQADPFLSSANAFTWGNSTTTTQYDGTHNWDPYLAGGTFSGGDTAEDIFTIHSPELSFNRPFLSPWEIRTYGLCTGTSIGRFIKSEGHPKQKVLRNISMWVAIIVGIGYAMMEMRGKRKKKFTPPKALNVGQTGHGNERSGGDVNTLTAGILVPGTLIPGVPPPTVSGTSGTSGIINTTQSGGDWDQAAPSSIDLTAGSDLLLDNNASMMTEYGNQGEDGTGATILDPSGASRNMQLSTLTMGGAPKLGMSTIPLSYEATTQTAYSNITGTAATDRGFIGAGTSVEYEGSRFESAPSATQVLFGVFNFMNFTAEGGQHIIDLIYNLVSYQDYAFKYSGHGLYLSTQNLPAQGVHRMLVEKARYIGPTIQNLSANIKINNLQRPSTVALNSFAPNNQSFALPIQAEDDSRFTIGSFQGWYNPSQWRVAPIAAHYISLKVAFKNQYGQIDQIKQLPTGCWFDWPTTHQQFADDSDGNEFQVPLEDATYEGENALTFTYEDRPYTVNENTRFYTPTIFAGDTYINRYTEKVIMPFFWDFLKGQPDGFPYDYRLRANVPRPIHWMNSAKYDLSELVRYITSFGWIFGGSAALVGALPNQMFFLDRDGTDLVQDGFGGGGGGTTGGAPPGGSTPTPGDDMGAAGSGGKSLFHIKNGYFYTHINGIQDFFVESTLNVGLRDWEDINEKRHYDFADYTDTEAMFHADIIREDNFYKYDASLSRTRFNTQLVSWGLIQPRDYDPTVAAECFTHYPKRLIYSLQAQKEAKKDFWRVFLPMNYKDFKNRVNVIKPISKSGALVLFPNLAPAMFQGVDQLQTDLGTKLTIGDGGLFSQPMQNLVNADTAHEYGSCESARSVVNTPSGIFYISQAQGKVFQYDGSGIVNIANSGMKQWFNKYLPSVLLDQFPELEDCNGWIDNPVAGVGCQTVYDPNYDLVYFCKKDYEAINPECIEFIPCEGFFWNETLCGDQEVTYDCPPGYTYNPAAPPGRRCELITYEDPIIPEQGGRNDVDVVFVLSSSFITYAPDAGGGVDGGNIGNMQKFMRYVVEGLTDQLSEDKLRIGLCHYSAGRDNRSPLFKGQYDWTQNPDEMFEPFGIDSNSNGIMIGTGQNDIGNQVPLTSTISRLETWIGQSSGQSGGFMNYAADTDSIYGEAASTVDKPRGADIAGAYWVGLNLLYGQGSRNAKKLIIHLGDTYHRAYGSAAGTYSSEEYTLGITGTDVFAPDGINSMSVTPTTPEQDIGSKQPTTILSEQYDTNDNACNWIQDNVINNTTYTNDVTFQQENLMVIFPPELAEIYTYDDLENQIIPYFNEFADTGEVYRVQSAGANDSTVLYNDIIEHSNAIINKITTLVGVNEEETDPCPDPNCNLIYNEADQPLCECISVVSETESNTNTPISLDDENYFKNVSWTVSYDPKAKAWISFHDWHPDLVIPSLNHFFTTKNFIDDSEPQCPPGMEYDPITQTCCQLQHFTYPADVILDEEIPIVNEIAADGCPLDIVLYVDSTGSTTLGGDLVWNAEKVFVDALVTALAPEMSAGNVQLGLYKWSGSGGTTGVNVTPGSLAMSNNTTSTTWGTDYLGDAIAGNTPFFTAAFAAQGMLNSIGPGLTSLGDRSDQIGYKRVLLFMSDGGSSYDGTGWIMENGPGSFADFQQSMSVSRYNSGGMGQPPSGAYTSNAELAGMTEVASETWGLYIFPGNTGAVTDYTQECFNIITYGRHPDGSYDLSWLPSDHPLYDATEPVDVDPTNYQNLALNSNDTPQLQQFANELYENLNCIQFRCLCPDGFVHVSTPESMDPLDYSPTIITDNISNCSPETAGTPIIGVCRRITCDCDEDNFNSTFIEGSFFTSGICDGDLGDQAIANYYAQSENFGYMLGDPNYINEDPLTCEYDGLCCIDPTFNKGGIWKHNDRCDLFTNYYELDYPWEVEIVESKGQTVNTVRSVEYQLESYIYNGNLNDNCGDRFHDLDWNFDEVIIHNTEQVSGLLRLDLNPKNNAPLITDYPIISGNDIRILYSKEEQKYRFNQFWDITDDRGEFSQASQSIFLTELNGYIRELNQTNLNYFKPAFQHKKFRHYWNKVIFRRSISENRKMILKLTNTKINASFR